MRKKKREEEETGGERWLITYADLITLLLAFFILMYTMSKQDNKKYQEVAAHLKAIFSGSNAVLATGNVAGNVPIELSFKGGAENVASLKEQLEKELREIGDKDAGDTMQKISLISDERGLVVRAMEKAFFEAGKADLTSRARSALDGIAPVLTKIPNHLRVEGHTDNVPINTSEFRSNWELSVRRATEVVRYLVERQGFPPDHISASGYAEYRPIASNDSPENRAMNRRIEIIILKTGAGENQPKQPASSSQMQTGKEETKVKGIGTVIAKKGSALSVRAKQNQGLVPTPSASVKREPPQPLAHDQRNGAEMKREPPQPLAHDQRNGADRDALSEKQDAAWRMLQR